MQTGHDRASLLMFGVLGLTSCQSGITELELRLRLQPELVMDRVYLKSITVDGQALLSSSKVLPARPGRPLETGDAITVRFDEEYAGRLVQVVAFGLSVDEIVSAEATADRRLLQGKTVATDLNLMKLDRGRDAASGGSPPDGGQDASDPSGGGRDGGPGATGVVGTDVNPSRSGALRRIAAGELFTCGLRSDGVIRCWGSNSDGWLGNGSTAGQLSPVTVPRLQSAATLSIGDVHSCALTTGGQVSCWGTNQSGQLGDGTMTSRTLPALVTGIPPVADVSVGSNHSCVVLAGDGTARCWGSNAVGQLGDGSITNRTSPVDVAGLGQIQRLAVGRYHTCALLLDRTVRCWGGNVVGELGDGTSTSRTTPAPVPGLTDVVEIVAGWEHTCVLLGSGSLYCWGGNADGQLGDGTYVSRRSPILIGGLPGPPAKLSASRGQTCAVLMDGSAYCWGFNGTGQLGDGTQTSRSTPARVGLTEVVDIALGLQHGCAMLTNDRVRCWGYNSNGQLGDGSTTSRLTAVEVTGF